MLEVVDIQERLLKMAGITVENVHINHVDYKLKGRVYRAGGDEAKPSAIICHGYPGDTKNMDLAEELALNGYNVLIFYYMGGWGSEGTYSFSNLTPSAKSALDWFIEQPYVDPKRVALISHSMGAIPITNLMVEDKRVKTGILMSPAADLSMWIDEEFVDNMANIFIEMAKGKLETGDSSKYKASMIYAAKELNPVEKAGKIKVPLMFIVGSTDKVTTPESCKMLYDRANQPKEWILLNGADHSYTEHRIPLQKSVLDWLMKNL